MILFNMKKKIVLLVVIVLLTVLAIVLHFKFQPIGKKYSEMILDSESWNSIVGSRNYNENLSLEEISFNGYRLLLNNDTNMIYYSLIMDSKNKYDPKVSYQANSDNVNLAIFQDEITEDKVKDGHEFSVMIYNETDYRIYHLKCTEYSLIDIRYDTSKDWKKDDRLSDVFVFNNQENSINRIVVSKGYFEIGDEGYYKLALFSLSPGKSKRDSKVQILKLKPSNNYFLEKMNEIREEDEKAGGLVELFINGVPQGIYGISETDSRLIIKK